jgi:BASS family bile acid:Na+ symporter
MNTIDILISSALGLIMFGIGSSLKFKHFKSLFKRTKPIITGLSFQMIFLPIFAFLLVAFSNLSPELKIGLFIVSICPGGTTSNFISYIVKADVELSVTLTSINSILILFTIPLLSNLAISSFHGDTLVGNITIYNTFLHVLFILLVPAVLGIWFKEKFNNLSLKIQRPLKILNTLLIALVFGIKFFAGTSSGGSGISQVEVFKILPYALVLHFGTMLTSYFLAKKISINNLQSTTIGIEVGLQNTTLALLVTGTLIGNNEMTKPALVYAIFSFFTTLIFALVARNIKFLRIYKRKLKNNNTPNI